MYEIYSKYGVFFSKKGWLRGKVLRTLSYTIPNAGLRNLALECKPSLIFAWLTTLRNLTVGRLWVWIWRFLPPFPALQAYLAAMLGNEKRVLCCQAGKDQSL